MSKSGGDLVTITSQEEDDFVASTFTASLGTGSVAWIGLTDGQAYASTNVTSPYQWVTGEPLNYTDWNVPSAEPNHWCSNPPTTVCTPGGGLCCQHRGVMGTDGTWYDRDDMQLYPSVCEAAP
jgi:hypothetical protein